MLGEIECGWELPPDKVVEINQDDPPQFDPVRVSRGDDAPLLTCQEVPSKVVEINQDDTLQFDPVESRRPSSFIS